MEKGQNGSFKGKKDIKGRVDSPAYLMHLQPHLKMIKSNTSCG